MASMTSTAARAGIAPLTSAHTIEERNRSFIPPSWAFLAPKRKGRGSPSSGPHPDRRGAVARLGGSRAGREPGLRTRDKRFCRRSIRLVIIPRGDRPWPRRPPPILDSSNRAIESPSPVPPTSPLAHGLPLPLPPRRRRVSSVVGPIGNGEDHRMGTPDPPGGERCAELLCLAGWTTSVRAFDVQGRTYWVVWCTKGGNQVAGRGDSRGAARRTAYRETMRARLHSPALSHASFLPDASARTTRGSPGANRGGAEADVLGQGGAPVRAGTALLGRYVRCCPRRCPRPGRRDRETGRPGDQHRLTN
jgi:hypothetical protein